MIHFKCLQQKITLLLLLLYKTARTMCLAWLCEGKEEKKMCIYKQQ